MAVIRFPAWAARKRAQAMPRNYGLYPTKYERLGTVFNPEESPHRPIVIVQDTQLDSEWGSLFMSLFVILGLVAVVGCMIVGAYGLAMVVW